MKTQYTNLISEYFKGKPVEKAWVFGSYSRNEETPESDIDLLVRLDKDAVVSLLDFCRMIRDLESLLRIKVDMVDERGLAAFAQPYVDHDKILVYERAR